METLCFYGVFFFCGCVWQIFVFIVEESEKMNSKHRKRVPTSVFSPSRTTAYRLKIACWEVSQTLGLERSIYAWTDEKERCKSNSE